MGERIYQADLLLNQWGWAIIDNEYRKLRLPKSSAHVKIPGGGGKEYLPEPTEDEKRIGKFMAENLNEIEWKVCASLWGPRFSLNRTATYQRIRDEVGWGQDRVRSFENRILQRVAMEVV